MAKKELNVGQLFEIQENLNTILAEHDWPVSLSFKLAEFLDVIDPKIEKYNKLRQEIITKYAKKDEEGNVVKATDSEGNILEDRIEVEDINNLQKDINELLFQTVKIDFTVELTPADFGDVKLNGSLIKNIKPILSKDVKAAS